MSTALSENRVVQFASFAAFIYFRRTLLHFVEVIGLPLPSRMASMRLVNHCSFAWFHKPVFMPLLSHAFDLGHHERSSV